MAQQKPIEFIYAEAKATLTLTVREVLRDFPLPPYMVESLFTDILQDYRNEAYLHLALASKEYQEQLKKTNDKEKKDGDSESEVQA